MIEEAKHFRDGYRAGVEKATATAEGAPLSDEDLAALEVKSQSATPLPWRACKDGQGGCCCGQVWSVPADSPVAECNKEWGDGPGMIYGELPDGHREANMVFISAACNAAPSLIAEARRSRAALSALLKWRVADKAFLEADQYEHYDATVADIRAEEEERARNLLRAAADTLRGPGGG